MRIDKVYKCDVCDYETKDYEEFQKHKAEELGLTLVEYNDYTGRRMYTKYKLSGYLSNKSDKNKEEYKIALRRLLSFEEYHGLTISTDLIYEEDKKENDDGAN